MGGFAFPFHSLICQNSEGGEKKTQINLTSRTRWKSLKALVPSEL